MSDQILNQFFIFLLLLNSKFSAKLVIENNNKLFYNFQYQPIVLSIYSDRNCYINYNRGPNYFSCDHGQPTYSCVVGDVDPIGFGGSTGTFINYCLVKKLFKYHSIFYKRINLIKIPKIFKK